MDNIQGLRAVHKRILWIIHRVLLCTTGGANGFEINNNNNGILILLDNHKTRSELFQV